MTREGPQYGAQLCFLCGRQHEAFEIAKPNRRTCLVGENRACRLDKLVQGDSGEVNPVRLFGDWDRVDRQH